MQSFSSNKKNPQEKEDLEEMKSISHVQEQQIQELKLREAKLLVLLNNIKNGGVDVDRIYKNSFKGDLQEEFDINNVGPGSSNLETFDTYFKSNQNLFESDRFRDQQI